MTKLSPAIGDRDHYAEGAAEAAEAAAGQGKFWEMHDLLFETEDDLQSASLARVEEDLESGIRSGVEESIRAALEDRS